MNLSTEMFVEIMSLRGRHTCNVWRRPFTKASLRKWSDSQKSQVPPSRFLLLAVSNYAALWRRPFSFAAVIVQHVRHYRSTTRINDYLATFFQAIECSDKTARIHTSSISIHLQKTTRTANPYLISKLRAVNRCEHSRSWSAILFHSHKVRKLSNWFYFYPHRQTKKKKNDSLWQVWDPPFLYWGPFETHGWLERSLLAPGIFGFDDGWQRWWIIWIWVVAMYMNSLLVARWTFCLFAFIKPITHGLLLERRRFGHWSLGNRKRRFTRHA